jgi:hypothetical protein
MSNVMSKKEFMALSKAERTKAVKRSQKKPRRPRPARQRSTMLAPGPARNGSGRKRGQKRQRGGKVTVAGNTREFRVPIDEDIGIVNGSTGFTTTVLALNPGSPITFPFLSRIAQNYERYEFESLSFHVKPSVSVFATQGTQGFVGISVTMDPAQAAPINQTQADIMFHAPVVESAVPTSISIPKSFMQSKSLREKFLVRQNGNIPGGNDPHTYDCGQLFQWTNGQVNNNQIGLLRVTGSVKLSNPALDFGAAASALPNYTVSLYTVVNFAIATSGTAFLVPFGTVNFNNLGVTVDATNTIFTLPPGNFNVDISADVDGNTPTTGLAAQYTCVVNGVGVGPVISNTCPTSATNGLTLHAAGSLNWFIRSNGFTTFSLRCLATFSGTADIDAMIRFTAM